MFLTKRYQILQRQNENDTAFLFWSIELKPAPQQYAVKDQTTSQTGTSQRTIKHAHPHNKAKTKKVVRDNIPYC